MAELGQYFVGLLNSGARLGQYQAQLSPKYFQMKGYMQLTRARPAHANEGLHAWTRARPAHATYKSKDGRSLVYKTLDKRKASTI